MPEPDQEGLFADAEEATNLEVGATERLMAAVPQEVLRVRQALAQALGRIAKEGTVRDGLEIERHIMQAEQERLAADSVRAGSLNAGTLEAAAALHVNDILENRPDDYRIMDEGRTLSKNRLGDLPDDEARQFFKSHRTRLVNDKRSRHDDSEIAVLDARLALLKSTELKYIALQRQVVLGLNRQPRHSRDSGQGGG